MPHYTFELCDGSRRIQDRAGIQLHDRSAAHDYAQEVVRELMSGCERTTRTWCLEVYEDDGARVDAVSFVSIDPTLDHLAAAARTLIEGLCDRRRSFQEVVSTAQVTMRESRALVARSRGKPYLATANGERAIRGG
ncbi:MAG: hypothetical protein WBF58_10855 [Xanthobacteraceae bacterium]